MRVLQLVAEDEKRRRVVRSGILKQLVYRGIRLARSKGNDALMMRGGGVHFADVDFLDRNAPIAAQRQKHRQRSAALSLGDPDGVELPSCFQCFMYGVATDDAIAAELFLRFFGFFKRHAFPSQYSIHKFSIAYIRPQGKKK